jgi:hypothetical protein
MDQFLDKTGRYRFELEVERLGRNDGNLVLGRRDLAFLPRVECDGDLGAADCCRFRDPNRAVKIDVSAPLL